MQLQFLSQYRCVELMCLVHSFIHSFISVDPYRITHPLDMESGYNNTECVNNYNIRGFSAI